MATPGSTGRGIELGEFADWGTSPEDETTLFVLAGSVRTHSTTGVAQCPRDRGVVVHITGRAAPVVHVATYAV